MTRTPLAIAIVLTLLLASPRAHAYSDLASFGTATTEGGAGNRWFTGSPADGYGCSVCHTHGPTVKGLKIESLPERYLPGATYEITLSWPLDKSIAEDGVAHVSALVEFTDETGNAAGSVSVPGGTAMTERDACEPFGLRVPAAHVFDAPNGRKVVGLEDCGGRQLRLQWTAPKSSMGTLFFSGGVVQSDDKSNLAGDSVLELLRPILAEGQSTYDAETKGGCAVRPGASCSNAPHVRYALVLGFGVCMLNRLRRRRS